MKISVSAPEADGISIIPAADLGPITLLEGNNGIGKSTLVRVLQICAGQLPYPSNPRAWSSLRESLGRTTVRISELATASVIEWRFDTRKWLAKEGAPKDDWFDAIEVDGKSSSLSDAGLHLSVYRLSGDSDIAGSFAERVETYGVTFNIALAQLTEGGRSPWAAASGLLADASDLSHVADGQALASEATAFNHALRRRDDAAMRLTKATEAKSNLAELVVAERELHELQKSEPDVRARLKSLAEQLRTKETERTTVVKALQSLASAAAVGEKDKNELEAAERNYSRNFDLLRDAELQLSEIRAVLSIEPPDEVRPDLEESLVAKLKDLTHRRDAIDRTPAVRQLVNHLADRLSRAHTDGLDDERALPSSFEALSTVGALSLGVSERLEELRALPTPDTAEIDEQIAEATKKLKLIREIPKARANIKRLRALVDKHQSALKLLAESKNLAATEEYEGLSLSLASADNEMLTLQSEQARLTQVLSQLSVNGDLGVLATRVRRLRQNTGLADAANVELAHQAAISDLAGLETEVRSLEAELEKAQRQHDSRLASITSTAGRLADDPNYQWLRDAAGDLVPSSTDSPSLVAIKVDTIFRRLNDAANSAQQFRRDLLAVSAALDALAKTLRGTAQTTDLYFGPLRTWFEDQFSDYFNHAAVREAMFPPDATEIRVNLSELQVEWREGSSAKQRAFDTFSSGQQAFAYARAQLGMIDAEPNQASTRLVCLDEFGAFLSADRRSELVSYLRDRTSRFANDRVLLTLPVRYDYGEAAENALGAERKRLTNIAHELEQAGYFQEVL